MSPAGPIGDSAESRRLWRLAGMGGTLASEVLAGALIGWLLDKAFGTAPTLLIVVTVGGVVVGMVTFIRGALKEAGASATAARAHGLPAPLEDEPDADPDDDRTPD